MKITRHKLNSLLRSGLNPDITTRKQLAKILELDPTSLTRWFASHDRLGNPRYPVVPDRHVKSILRLFSLQPSDLNLSDENFKQFCFDKAFSISNDSKEASTTAELPVGARENHFIIPEPKQNITAPWLTVCILGFLAFALTVRSDLKTDSLFKLNQMIVDTPNTCWRELKTAALKDNQLGQEPPSTFYPLRFSSDFDSTMEVNERCSYQAILEQGLVVLNKNPAPKLDNAPSLVDLLAFVSKKLDDSQTERKAILRFEMGRKEIRMQQLQQASVHFSEALELLSSIPSVNEELFKKLSTYSSLANYGDKAWWYARQLSDSVFLNPKTEKENLGNSWRAAARADAAIGRTFISSSNIDRALYIDSKHLGYDHPVMASNWLLKSQILNLHGDLRQAREYAHRAIVLDTYLFGENHSRVAQDKMHYAMIILQEGRLSEAYEIYRSGYNFFLRYPFSNHAVLKSGDSFLKSLDLLRKTAGVTNSVETINTNSKAWSELRQALLGHDFMLPRCLTTKIWQQLLKQQSLAS